MSLPVYLAMTAAEINGCSQFPEKLGYMACHFSAYGTGLSNIPDALPANSLLIVNDRTPVCGHDPELVCLQLAQAVECLECDGVLLDFQRPGVPQTAAITKAVVAALSCPVGVTEYYAQDHPCPVFLSPPMHRPLEAVLPQWQGREIWLELTTASQQIILTKDGCRFSPLQPPVSADNAYYADTLCCRYYTKVSEQQIKFTLFRTAECLKAYLAKAEALGIPRAIGLYQELNGLL